MKRITIVCVLLLSVLLVVLLTGCGLSYRQDVGENGSRIITFTVSFAEGERDQIPVVKGYLDNMAKSMASEHCEVTVDRDASHVWLTKYYATATDYEIDNGLTGNEVYPPMEGENHGFFTTYDSTSTLISTRALATYLFSYNMLAQPSLCNHIISVVIEHRRAIEEHFHQYDTLYLPSPQDFLKQFPNMSVEAMAEIVGLFRNSALPDTVPFEYMYSHVYDNVEGIDCTDIRMEGDQKVYVWQMSAFDLDTASITLRQTTPTVWVWETIAIGAGVLVAVVLTIVVIIKRRNKHGESESRE